MFANIHNYAYFCKHILKKNMEPNIIRQNSAKAWLLAARPKTLTGAAVPVMIGLSMAYTDAASTGIMFNWTAAALCFLFAMTMQVDANFINDYFDFIKGTDDTEKRLGPRRACAQGWVKASSMKYAIAFTTLAACAIGFPLIFYGGIEMLLVGAVCVLFCFLYTTFLSYIGLGDVLVLVFFGLVPVCVTYYIQLRTCPWTAVAASVACGLVIDCLLLINNYRDRDTDREAGKCTLVVRLGAHCGRLLYLSSGLTACLLGIVFAINGHWAACALPVVSYLPLHIGTYRKIVRINRGKALNICLGETARNMFVYGLAVSIGLLI